MATSETAGTFTCAELLTILVAIDRVWANGGQTMQDFQSYAESVNVIRQRQTARFPELENKERDEKVKVYWVTDCNTSIEDCGNDCEIGGPELEARCEEYELDLCKRAGFTVKEKYFRQSNLTRQEVIAKGLMKRMKELDEYLAQTLIAKLNAFAGTNQFEGIGTVGASGTTYILPSFWTADLAAYFQQVAMMNKLTGAFMLHGNNLWNVNWQAQLNSVDPNGKAALAKLGTIPQFWDPFNVDTVNAGSKVSYMIAGGAVAIVNKAYYPLNSPVEYKDDTRWSIESKSLPGIFYDVVYTNRCESNEIYHDYTLYLNAGIFKNPVGCNEDVTGILKFVCGDGSEES